MTTALDVKTALFCLQCKKPFSPRNKHRRKFCSGRCSSAYHQMAVPSYLPELSTATIGALNELRVCVDLLAKGYEVFRSVSPSCSCDLIICKKGVSVRVEVRTAYRNKNGEVVHPKSNIRAECVAAVLDDEIIYKPELPDSFFPSATTPDMAGRFSP